ncbi:glycoside hydrolase family 3 C-terminal domain-containing protein [Flavobacterium johnsoniae]|uniref:glycoside hydrolase family 3 C-terminal domain-containing protein n=1 Tax=Flavobacterium TaxID=237 RepID=UPI0023E3D6A2|nr:MULTISPECIES: glycoside hydrolase family 3 C-terminal domain-containing protein [Flavobacterium]WET04073.1 glycoside hydrolase family 3 C-terminal domain-containing protein [Flavobacterium sp. YJ01]WJS94560.1 glycoside hydrolase family 3 C-terminal domain-containing protein [Flavobacterium johnsoniae]
MKSQHQKWFDESLSFEKRVDLLLNAMTIDEKCGQFTSDTPAIPRLGVPEYNWWNEALHGVARNGKATIFPQGIAMGATFNPSLIKEVANAISDEARAKFQVSKSIGNRGIYAGLTFWSPNINIFRDPRWGRGQETYGEDPFLTSKIGVAFVEGLQGKDPKYFKTTACAKHFAVHSGPEALRHSFNANPSKLDLYETYLPAFKSLVQEGKVQGIMGAYNAVYGDPANASKLLMDDILKKQWGFEGYIVSDCGALVDIMKGHKKVKTVEEAAALALKTGVNLNCGWVYKNIKSALDKGLITEELINERLKKLFLIRFQLGFFDKDESNPYNTIGIEVINSDAHKAVARKASQQSIVLLKNKDNVLPLDKNIKTLYVTGSFAASTDILLANYYGSAPNMVTVLEGITEKVSLGTSVEYRLGVLPFQNNLNPLNWAVQVPKTVDATVLVAGISNEIEGEEVDAIASEHKGDRKDLKLPQSQIDYIKAVSKNKKGPLILVLGTGSPVSLDEVEPYVDAIVLMWYPGEQGGNAVADVIFGDVAPSGHLPITFPKNVEQLPPFDDYSMKGRTYKYMTEEPMYPFGFGLSYSTLEIKNPSSSETIIKKGKRISVSVDVKNSGDKDYEDVIQMYLVPEDTKDFLPFYALKSFQRVPLNKGETKKLTFNLTEEDLKQTNLEGEKTWIKGNYKLLISNALPSHRSANLGAAKPAEIKIKLK